MATFQDAVNQLTTLINEYITERNLLFTNKYAYDHDPWVKEYNKREMAFTLFSAKEAAEACTDYYKIISSDSQYSAAQKQIFADRYAIFEKQTKQDGISGNPIAPQLVQITNPSPFTGNMTQTVKQLHLMQDALIGLLKMGGATKGDFIQLIIGYTQSGGLATGQVGNSPLDPSQNNVLIDINMLFTQMGLVAHILEHEIGHRDYAQWYRLTGPANITNLPFYRPSFITDSMSQPQRDETLADVYSAIVAAIFGTPLHDPFSRFLNQVTPPTPGPNTDTHPPVGTRADIAQKVYSTLMPLFRVQNNSIWYDFAQEIRNIAQLQFADFPSFGDFDQVMSDYPFNKQQQRAALQQRFPRLAMNTSMGYPPSILVDSDALLKLANPSMIQLNQPFDPNKLVSVETFQANNPNPLLFTSAMNVASSPLNPNPTAAPAIPSGIPNGVSPAPVNSGITRLPNQPLNPVSRPFPGARLANRGTILFSQNVGFDDANNTSFVNTTADTTVNTTTDTASSVPTTAPTTGHPKPRLARPPKTAPSNMAQTVPFTQPSPVKLVEPLPYYSDSVARSGSAGYYTPVPLEELLLNGPTVQPLTTSVLPRTAEQSMLSGTPIVTQFMFGRVAWRLMQNASEALTKRWTHTGNTVEAFAGTQSASGGSGVYKIRYTSVSA